MKRKLSKVMLGCVVAIFVSLTGCGNGDKISTDSTQTTGIAQQYSDSKDDSSNEKSTKEKSTIDGGSANNIDLSLSPSEGLEFESNGDGTCTITGLGTCTDTDIVIPTVSPSGDTVTLIDKYAFYNSDDIKGVTLLNYDYEVGESSFQYGKYEYINIIGGNPQIEKSAFSSCEKIKEVNITDCNIEVDKYGFYNGGKDMAITFNNCTGTIDESAFQYCDVISIEINNCDLEINKSAFSSCEDLEYISFSNSKLTTEEYAFYNGGDSAIVEMTDCELYFDDSAFQYCSIESLTINGSSVEMEKSVFSSCEDLTTVTIDCDSVILGEYAFYNCKDLIDVSICDNSKSENAISIDDSAFQYCEDLESVTIGSGTIKIGKYVFLGSDKNPTITIAGQTYIADQIRDGIK